MIIIIILVVSWGITLVAGPMQTHPPTFIISLERITPGTYIFTVVDVLGDDVSWSDIQGRINPSGPILTKQQTNGDVKAGDSFVISNMIHGASYSIALIYKPNGYVCYQVSLIAD